MRYYVFVLKQRHLVNRFLSASTTISSSSSSTTTTIAAAVNSSSSNNNNNSSYPYLYLFPPVVAPLMLVR